MKCFIYTSLTKEYIFMNQMSNKFILRLSHLTLTYNVVLTLSQVFIIVTSLILFNTTAWKPSHYLIDVFRIDSQTGSYFQYAIICFVCYPFKVLIETRAIYDTYSAFLILNRQNLSIKSKKKLIKKVFKKFWIIQCVSTLFFISFFFSPFAFMSGNTIIFYILVLWIIRPV